MNKNWNESIIETIGTLLTDENGKIKFTANKFGKYTATLKIAANTRWSRLERKNTFIFVDGLRPSDVEDIQSLEADGEITATTRLVVTGHLVRSSGKPGMNDVFNIKTLGIRPAAENEQIAINLDEALTKDEWQTIRKEKFGGTTAYTSAPAAPVAPSIPF